MAGGRRARTGGNAVIVALTFLNVFGTDSFGTGATPWQQNITSNSFGTLNTVYPRQQAELAVRFGW